MSIVSFRPAMSLAVEEDGSGKPIAALRLIPTAATRRRLADHRLVFRPRSNGFQIYGQHNPQAGDARLAPITVRTPLVFGAWLVEPDLLERYHPDLDAAGGASLYLSNLNADGSVRASGVTSRGDTVEAADSVRIVGRRSNARADLTASPPPTTLRVVDRYDLARIVANVAVNAVANSTSASVALDLSVDRATAYTLVPQPAGAPQSNIFVDDELAGASAFAVIELVAAPLPGPSPAAGRRYFARFRRRS